MLEAVFSRTLEEHTSLPSDWQLHKVVVRGRTLQLDLGPPRGVLARIAVADASDSEFKSYKRGVRYATSYEHVAKDDDPSGTIEAQPVALRLCEEIAELSSGFEFEQPTEEIPVPEGPLCSREELLEMLARHLEVGGVLVDGWILRSVTPVEAIEVHCIFEHPDIPMLPRLVLHHGSGNTKERVVRQGWKVTYKTRFGMSAPLRISAYFEILAEALRDLLGAVK